MTGKELTPKQQLFAEEFLLDLNGKQAAIRAGYAPRSAEVTACRMLRIAKVAAAIQEGMDKRSKRTEIDADYVLKRLHEIESFDFGEIIDDDGSTKPIKDWPGAIRRSVASIEVVEDFAGKGEDRECVGYTKKIKIEGRTKPLELIARHLGMLDTKVELDSKDGFIELLERTKNSPLGSPQGIITERLKREKKKIH